MKHLILISDRRLRRFLYAEKVCQATREYITAPVNSNPGLGHVADLIHEWICLAPKRIAYGDSHEPVPRKWRGGGAL